MNASRRLNVPLRAQLSFVFAPQQAFVVDRTMANDVVWLILQSAVVVWSLCHNFESLMLNRINIVNVCHLANALA